jgi:hypothetical protein
LSGADTDADASTPPRAIPPARIPRAQPETFEPSPWRPEPVVDLSGAIRSPRATVPALSGSRAGSRAGAAPEGGLAAERMGRALADGRAAAPRPTVTDDSLRSRYGGAMATGTRSAAEGGTARGGLAEGRGSLSRSASARETAARSAEPARSTPPTRATRAARTEAARRGDGSTRTGSGREGRRGGRGDAAGAGVAAGTTVATGVALGTTVGVYAGWDGSCDPDSSCWSQCDPYWNTCWSGSWWWSACWGWPYWSCWWSYPGYCYPWIGWGWGWGWGSYYGGYWGWPVENTTIIYEQPAEQVVVEEVPAAEAAPAGAEPSVAPEIKDALRQAADEWLVQGDMAFREGRYSDAVRHYARAVEYEPARGSMWLILSDALFATGDYHYAAYALRRALELEPKLLEPVVDKHEWYGNPADFDRHIDYAEAYLRDHVLDEDARLILAANQLFARQAPKAVELLQSAFGATLRETDAGRLVLERALGSEPR